MRLAATWAAVGALICAAPASAADFYAGKQITLIAGAAAAQPAPCCSRRSWSYTECGASYACW